MKTKTKIKAGRGWGGFKFKNVKTGMTKAIIIQG